MSLINSTSPSVLMALNVRPSTPVAPLFLFTLIHAVHKTSHTHTKYQTSVWSPPWLPDVVYSGVPRFFYGCVEPREFSPWQSPVLPHQRKVQVRFGERRWETDSRKGARHSSPTLPYIRLLHAFVYLVVIMDWFSRYVLSLQLSITLARDFCIEALKQALLISRHEIFNSDQGSQYASEEFINILKEKDIDVE